jgi:hypothetical protein
MSADRTQLTKLVQPIPPKFVKEIDVGGGRKEPYVPHEIILQFLLYTLGPVDFEVLELLRGDVAEVPPNPQARSDRGKQGTPRLTNVVVGARCQLTATIDGSNATIVEIGDVEDPHNWNNDGKRAKAAASDGLKRCAMRLGLGLHIWTDRESYLLDKWLPLPPRDTAAQGNGSAGPAQARTAPASTEPPAQPATHTRQQDSAEPAEAPPPASPTAEARATAATSPAAEARADIVQGGPLDAAQNMEQLATALHRSLTNVMLRLRRAGQLPPDDRNALPEQPFAHLGSINEVKKLSGDDFKLAKAWLLDAAGAPA